MRGNGIECLLKDYSCRISSGCLPIFGGGSTSRGVPHYRHTTSLPLVPLCSPFAPVGPDSAHALFVVRRVPLRRTDLDSLHSVSRRFRPRRMRYRTSVAGLYTLVGSRRRFRRHRFTRPTERLGIRLSIHGRLRRRFGTSNSPTRSQDDPLRTDLSCSPRLLS